MDSENTLSPFGPTLINRAFFKCKTFIVNLDWEIKLLLLLPLVLIFLNDSWIYSNILAGWIDAWIYLGHFVDLKQHLNTFAGTYYGTRLPWILPGFLAHQFFSPLLANYIFHLVFYCCSTISLFLILKHTLDRRTALITTILMSFSFIFLLSQGSHYIDGAGVTYLLLTLLILTPKKNARRPKLRLLMAGMFYGCLIYTQLFLITFTPIIIIYYYFINPEHKLKSLRHCLYGFIAITLLLCFINYCLNGIFFFFMPIVNWTSNFVSSGVNSWWTPISTWWMKAWWLLVPLITLIGSFLSTRHSLNQRVLILFQGCFIINVLMYIALDLFAKQPVLSYVFYSSYLMPAMFLAIGAQLSPIISKLTRSRFYIMLGAIVFIVFLPYAFPIQPIPQLYLITLLLLSGIAGLFVAQRYNHFIGIILITISLTSINILGMHLQPLHSRRHDLPFYRQSYHSVVKGSQFVRSSDPKIKALFWYDCNEPSGCVFRSIASMNLWGYRLISENFPKISGENSYHLPILESRIFLLSSKDNVIEEANKSLASMGFMGEIIDEKTIAHSNMSYKITYLKLSKLKDPSQERTHAKN